MIDNNIWNDLLEAIYGNQPEQVKFYLCLAKDVNDLGPDTATTLLMHAAFAGHKHILLLLLQAGALVSKKDDVGWTAVDYAWSTQHVELAHWLTKEGKNREGVKVIAQKWVKFGVRYSERGTDGQA